MIQTREELEKQGLILPKKEIEKYARAYASRVPSTRIVTEFKEALVEAYLVGVELATDFYLEHR